MTNSRLSFGFNIFLLFSGFAVTASFILQHFFGFEPCYLCLLQRKFMIALLLISFAGLMVSRYKVALLGLCVLLMVGALGIALYQVGVEHHWVPLPAGCQSTGLAGDSIDQMREALLAKKHVPCDVVTWSFLGISLAGYSALFYLLALVIAGLVMRMRAKLPASD